MSDITFALTSCGRFDFLETTLDTFLKFNTHPIKKYYVIEDSLDNNIDKLINKYPFIDFIVNKEKLGQIKSIDKMYSLINTEYIFHCEDDWEFFNNGFIEKSLKILKSNENIFQVWIRDPRDHIHPLKNEIYATDGVEYKHLMQNALGGFWDGFSFNPGLRRKKQYDLISPFEKIGPEVEISITYKKFNFQYVSLLEGYCRHIGWSRRANGFQI